MFNFRESTNRYIAFVRPLQGMDSIVVVWNQLILLITVMNVENVLKDERSKKLNC